MPKLKFIEKNFCRRYGFLPYHSACCIAARALAWYGRKPYLLWIAVISFPAA